MQIFNFLNNEPYHGTTYVDGILLLMELIAYMMKNHIAHFLVSLRVLYMCIKVLISLRFKHCYF
jgi:hypothetical protein